MSQRPTPLPPPVPPVPTVPPGNPQPRPHNPLLDVLYSDIAAAVEAYMRLQSPARHGSIRPPAPAGVRPSPGSAATVPAVVRESPGAAVVAVPGAGESSDPRPRWGRRTRTRVAPGVGPSHDPMPVPPRPRPKPGGWGH